MHVRPGSPFSMQVSSLHGAKGRERALEKEEEFVKKKCTVLQKGCLLTQ